MSVANEENAVKMSDYDEGWHEGMKTVLGLAHKRIEDLEAKLAKAVETISLCRKMQAQFAHTEDPLIVLLDTTIAELSSVSCANLKGQNDE
jgi:ribosome-interacting GTPase 1